MKLMFPPIERTSASVRADAVIAAFELADTQERGLQVVRDVG